MIKEDLTGQKFNMLTIIKELGHKQVLCRCDCGKIGVYPKYKVKKGIRKSCGCLKYKNKIDLKPGDRFGMLTVIKKSPTKKGHPNEWVCQCDCGNMKIATSSGLIRSVTTSCGCQLKKSSKKVWKENLGLQIVENTNLSKLTNKRTKANTSGVRGVCFHKREGKWMAYIGIKGKDIFLGYYTSLGDAAKARRAAEEKYYKPILQKYAKVLNTKKD